MKFIMIVGPRRDIERIQAASLALVSCGSLILVAQDKLDTEPEIEKIQKMISDWTMPLFAPREVFIEDSPKRRISRKSQIKGCSHSGSSHKRRRQNIRN